MRMQRAKLQEKPTGKLNEACQPCHWLETVEAVRAPALVPGTHIVNHIFKGGTGHHPANGLVTLFSFMQSKQHPFPVSGYWGNTPEVLVEVAYPVQSLAYKSHRSER